MRRKVKLQHLRSGKNIIGMDGKRQGLRYFLYFAFSLHLNKKGSTAKSPMECHCGSGLKGSNKKRSLLVCLAAFMC